MTIQLTIGGATKRSKFTPATVNVDWDSLPEASRDFLVRYGVKQYLADATAGAESQSDYDAGIADRLAKMKDGTCGTRGTGEGKGPTDNVEVLARQLVRQAINAELKKAGIAKPEAEAMNAAISQVMESPDGKVYRANAAQQIADRKTRAEGLSGVLAAMFSKEAADLTK